MDAVERVARAICKASGTIWGGPRGEDDPDFALPKAAYMNIARAAIEAMREPTDEMGNGLPDNYRPGSHSAKQVWQAMIDAALTPPSDPQSP